MKIQTKVSAILQKYNQVPLAAKAGIWFVICTMLQKCIAFITVPIFTRIMPAEQYGLYSSYLSWYSVLTVFCTLNMHNCIFINNYTKVNSQQEKNGVAVPLLSLSEAITIILFVLYVIFHKYLDHLIGLPFAMVCLLFVQILFEPPVNFWSIQKRFEYRYIALLIRTLSMVVLNAVLGILFVCFSATNQAVARAVSIVLVQMIFGGILYFYFFRRAKCIFSVAGWKRALQVQLPLLPHGLSLTILSSSDKIMINALVGAAEAAIYSVAFSAGYIVNILKNSITDALTPWIYSKIKERDFKAIREKTKAVMIFVTIIAFIFTAFAPEVIKIMAPKEYYEAIYVIPPVAASSFFTFLYCVFSTVSFYYEKTKKIMIASVFGALLNILLNFIFIRMFGYLAAGYVTLLCYMFLAAAHYIIMCRVCKEELEGIKIFDLRFIICLSLIVLVMTLVFSAVYNYVFIRYGFIMVMGTAVFVKRKVFLDSLLKNK